MCGRLHISAEHDECISHGGYRLDSEALFGARNKPGQEEKTASRARYGVASGPLAAVAIEMPPGTCSGEQDGSEISHNLYYWFRAPVKTVSP